MLELVMPKETTVWEEGIVNGIEQGPTKKSSGAVDSYGPCFRFGAHPCIPFWSRSCVQGAAVTSARQTRWARSCRNRPFVLPPDSWSPSAAIKAAQAYKVKHDIKTRKTQDLFLKTVAKM